MKSYGLNLAEGSVVNNLVVKSGPTLPSSDLDQGEMFFLTSGAYQGLYIYQGTEWDKVAHELPGVNLGPDLSLYSKADDATSVLNTRIVTPTTGQYLTYNSVLLKWENTSETFIDNSEKGSMNGVATLDNNGYLPENQLPLAATFNDITLNNATGKLKLGPGVSNSHSVISYSIASSGIKFTDNSAGLAATLSVDGNVLAANTESIGNFKVSGGLQITAGAGTDKVLVSDNTGNASWQTPSTSNQIIATSSFPGKLTVKNGESRYYPSKSVVIKEMHAWVGTAPTGTAISFVLQKNNVTVASGSIAQSVFKMVTQTGLNIPLTTDDYLTINITQVGSIISGRTLNIRVIME